ncbi:hypothetical protein BBD42_03790 [Paenibacillus sp. BIHB 4019]|uniref:Uncharacterized protein n=1 Tax=Paenibacillus sp. BIHB 4019 TaxID=1870819 RepID=A0A1B2DD88_9BACL|nr:hypothetical protein BBD42_03790 [Paenibacillus sp. BIHB 4019]
MQKQAIQLLIIATAILLVSGAGLLNKVRQVRLGGHSSRYFNQIKGYGIGLRTQKKLMRFQKPF